VNYPKVERFEDLHEGHTYWIFATGVKNVRGRHWRAVHVYRSRSGFLVARSGMNSSGDIAGWFSQYRWHGPIPEPAG
jgi:hypothetical protein